MAATRPTASPLRPRTACLTCLARKVRCNKAKPICARCLKSNLNCVYDSPPSIRTGSPADRPTSNQRVGGATPAPQAMAPPLGAMSTSLSDFDFSLADFTTSHFATSQDSTHQSDSEKDEHLVIDIPSRPRYVHGSHLAALGGSYADITSFVRAQQRYDLAFPGSHALEDQAMDKSGSSSTLNENMFGGDIMSHGPAFPGFGTTLSAKSLTFNDEILKDLPSRAQCDLLIKAYKQGYHVHTYYFHFPSFLQEYQDFWNQQEGPAYARRSRRLSFVALLSGVLFAGCISCDHAALQSAFPQESKERLSLIFHRSACRALRMSGFPRNSDLSSLAAFMITQWTWARVEEASQRLTSTAALVRAAQAVGLHRDPGHFPGLSPTDIEVRRRLWTQILYIDAIGTLFHGLPGCIDSTTWDVKPPSEIREEFLGKPEADLYLSAVASGLRPKDIVVTLPDARSTSMVSTQSLLVTGKHVEAFTYHSAGRIIYSGEWRSEGKSVQLLNLVMNARAELVDKISRIPTQDFSTLSQTDFAFDSSPKLNRFARLNLSAKADRTWMLVYNFALEVARREFWPNWLLACITCSITFLQKFCLLAAEEEFECFHWAWPGIHQPLQTIVFLLRLLSQQPHVNQASEILEAVDAAFGLCSPNGGIVSSTEGILDLRPLTDGGGEVWTFLSNLRREVWRRRNLDPDVFMSRAQALQYARTTMETSDIDDSWWANSPEHIAQEKMPSTSASGTSLGSFASPTFIASDTAGFFGFPSV